MPPPIARAYLQDGWCQTNGNSSPPGVKRAGGVLVHAGTDRRSAGDRASLFVDFAADEMALLTEMGVPRRDPSGTSAAPSGR